MNGVYFNKDRNKYYTHLTIDEKVKFFGYYKTSVETKIKYNELIKLYYGEFAAI